MRALILAAEEGTRIRPDRGDLPKCLIQFNRSTRTILDQQIDNLFSCGIRDIGVVVGYEKDRIVRHVVANYWGHLRRFRMFERRCGLRRSIPATSLKLPRADQHDCRPGVAR
jgi:dTDP-glucose pyrophosphorylase